MFNKIHIVRQSIYRCISYQTCIASMVTHPTKKYKHLSSDNMQIIKRQQNFRILFFHNSVVNLATKKAKAKKKGGSSSKVDFSVADGIFNLKSIEQKMEKQVEDCKEGMIKFSPKLTLASVGDIYVKVAGRKSKLFDVASITSSNNNEYLITPMVKTTESFNEVLASLSQSNLKLNPISNENVIRIPVPLASSERREVLLKDAKSHSENTKVLLRKIRQQGLNDLRKIKDSVSKDDLKRIEDQVQLLTEKYNGEIENIFSDKKSELNV